MQHRRHLRQGYLRPNHIFTRAPPYAVLRADPKSTVWGWWVYQHNIHSLLRTRASQQTLANDLIRIGEIRHTQFWDAPGA